MQQDITIILHFYNSKLLRFNISNVKRLILNNGELQSISDDSNIH